MIMKTQLIIEIDVPHATAQEIKAYVRDAIESYGGGCSPESPFCLHKWLIDIPNALKVNFKPNK